MRDPVTIRERAAKDSRSARWRRKFESFMVVVGIMIAVVIAVSAFWLIWGLVWILYFMELLLWELPGRITDHLARMTRTTKETIKAKCTLTRKE